MDKIITILSSDKRVVLSYRLVTQYGEEHLSSAELEDFVDSDLPLIYDGREMSINDYLGDSRCFAARQKGHSF